MNQDGWADPEDPEAKGMEFNDESIRKAFIRKVFAILSVRKIFFFFLFLLGIKNYILLKLFYYFHKVQLSLTLGVIALFIFVPAVSDFALKNFWYTLKCTTVAFM